MNKIKELTTFFGMAVLCSMITACASLDSQMSSYDSEVRSNIEKERWNAAERVIRTAEFKCEPNEQPEVTTWRRRENILLKSMFMKSLTNTVAEAKACYARGAFGEGDQVRQTLRDKYFGGQVEPVKGDPDKGRDTGIPDALVPCVKLAWMNILSDRNIARMSATYSELDKRVDGIDVNGRKESIDKLDAIAMEFEATERLKDKIKLFMEMLAEPETMLWAPIDRSTYSRSIKKMEKMRSEFTKKYNVQRWNTRVIDRRLDYERLAQLTAAKDYNAAMRLLASHDLIVKPKGLEGALDFNDPAERARIASEGLGEAFVKQIFETRLSGVRYPRRSEGRGLVSALIVGRTYVEDKGNRRKLREAGRVAQLQARAEFVRFLKSSIKYRGDEEVKLVNDEASESHQFRTSEEAEAEVSNLIVLATGIDGDEVVFILGWRDPRIGTISPAPMHRVTGEQNLTVSSSVGAYL